MNSKWLKSSGMTKRESVEAVATKRESVEAVATKKIFPKLTTRDAFGFARHLIIIDVMITNTARTRFYESLLICDNL